MAEEPLQIPSVATAVDLDGLRCGNRAHPAADPCPCELLLTCRNHPGAPSRTVYRRGGGVLEIRCAVCYRLTLGVAVASGPTA